MADITGAIRERARERGTPSLAQAVAATGGIAVAIGILLIAIDIRADHSGGGAEAALFAGLVLAGYLVLALAPSEIHAAGVSAIVLGIPGALGWAILPGAHRFADVRPFLLLTIAAWIVAFVVPHTRGRTIFVAAAALFLWLWILGEVAGTGAYSAAPVPSPPAHTLFSLQSFAGARPAVDLIDLDPSDALYPIAQECDDGDLSACDSLYRSAPAGSDFQQFGASCGNTNPDASDAGFCELSGSGSGSVSVPGTFTPLPFGGSTVPAFSPIPSFTGTPGDKSFDIGMVSAFFGIAYLGALLLLDRARWRGLATAFVVPGVVALVSGTQSLGDAAHHAWVGGVLTVIAGLGIGFIGDVTQRRFSTWAGAAVVAYGALVVALDTSHVSHAVSDGSVKLAGPGLVVMVFGVLLVALGFLIAWFLARRTGGGAPPFEETPWSGPTPTATISSASSAPSAPSAAPPWPNLPAPGDPPAWPPRS